MLPYFLFWVANRRGFARAKSTSPRLRAFPGCLSGSPLEVDRFQAIHVGVSPHWHNHLDLPARIPAVDRARRLVLPCEGPAPSGLDVNTRRIPGWLASPGL